MKNKRILVIEDEFLVALDIIAVLEQAGFSEVQHIDTEGEAFQRVKTESWDAVVADANLNGCSIERVATTLRERSIPFLLVTGYGKESERASLRDIVVIEKPFSGPQLARALTNLLQPR